MAMLKLFKSRLNSCHYLFSNGVRADFVSGRFQTGDEAQIAELEKEVAAGHPHIYIDTKESEVDSEALDPLEFIRRKAVADYLAEQAAKEGTNFGTSNNGDVRTGIMTTADTQKNVSESNSGAKVGGIKVGIKVGAK